MIITRIRKNRIPWGVSFLRMLKKWYRDKPVKRTMHLGNVVRQCGTSASHFLHVNTGRKCSRVIVNHGESDLSLTSEWLWWLIAESVLYRRSDSVFLPGRPRSTITFLDTVDRPPGRRRFTFLFIQVPLSSWKS